MGNVQLKYHLKSHPEIANGYNYRVLWSRFEDAKKLQQVRKCRGGVLLLFFVFIASIYAIWLEGYWGLILLQLPLLYAEYILLDKLSHRLEIEQTDQRFSLIEYRFWSVITKRVVLHNQVDFFLVSEAGDLEFTKNRESFVLYENKGKKTKNSQEGKQLYLRIDPKQMSEVVSRLNTNWNIDQTFLPNRDFKELRLWHAYDREEERLSLEKELIEYESFEDTQVFEFRRRILPNKEFQFWAMGLFFFLFGGLFFYGGLAAKEEPILWQIVFSVIGLSIICIPVLLLALMFSKTVVIQDKATVSIKRKYLGGLLQFVKSYVREDYSSFKLSEGFDLIAIKDEPYEETILLKQSRTNKDYTYQPKILYFLKYELNIFWEEP
jgi:hypothetical protein